MNIVDIDIKIVDTGIRIVDIDIQIIDRDIQGELKKHGLSMFWTIF